tara:strand:- start:1493 stop:1729 length:237 start_codon:yes stop_codon:yes gene_type:complete
MGRRKLHRRTIDLHGIRHQKVIPLLEKKLLNGKKDYLNTEVITGDSDYMKELVWDFLDEHDFQYMIESYNMGTTLIVG